MSTGARAEQGCSAGPLHCQRVSRILSCAGWEQRLTAEDEVRLQMPWQEHILEVVI